MKPQLLLQIDQLVSKLDKPAMVVDAEAKVLAANDSFGQLLGRPAEEVVGEGLAELGIDQAVINDLKAAPSEPFESKTSVGKNGHSTKAFCEFLPMESVYCCLVSEEIKPARIEHELHAFSDLIRRGTQQINERHKMLHLLPRATYAD